MTKIQSFVFAALLDVVENMLLVNVRGSFQQTIES